MSRPFALLLAGRLARFATHARGVMVAVSLLVPLLECQAAAPPHCTLAFTPYAKLPMRGGSHETLVFSPDGRTLAIGHGKDDGLVLYETASLRVRGGLPLPRKDDRTFSQAAFLNRGRWLAVSFASRVVVWDLAASKVIFSPVLHNIRVPARIAADSRSKLLATTEHDHAIGIWDVASGKELGRLEGHKKYNRGIAFSPDGKRIATAGSDTTVRLWDAATFRQLAVLRGHGDGVVGLVRFSPCGRTLLSGGLSPSDYGVVWWDVAKGVKRHNWGPQDSTVQGLAWGCAGRFVIVGVELTEDPIRPLPGRIRFWDNALQRECKTLEGPSEGLSNLACADTAGGTLLALAPRRERNILLHHTALPCPPAPPPLPKRPRPAEATLRKATLSLWDELASDDAGVAYRAVLRLTTTPRQALALMRQKLAVATPSDARAIEGHVADLGSEAFAARQAAEKALSALVERAVPWLHRAIEGPNLERRKRAERLLKQAQAPLREGDRLREVRAIETLEMLADPEARELLNELAQGALEARLTREARLAWGRQARYGE